MSCRRGVPARVSHARVQPKERLSRGAQVYVTREALSERRAGRHAPAYGEFCLLRRRGLPGEVELPRQKPPRHSSNLRYVLRGAFASANSRAAYGHA